MTHDCKTCPVSTGTHKPAEAVHVQIDEPQDEAMRLADECDESATHWVHEIDTRFKAAKMLRAQHARIEDLEAQHREELRAYEITVANREARIAELESQLEAIGAGGVEPLRKPAAPQAVQAAVPEAIEQMAVDRYKVVPSHESMFHRWAVVAGNGTQQLYIGREVECQNMALKFAGAFLDGAFVAMQNTAPAYPAEGVTAQAVYAEARECSHCNHVGLNDSADDIATCNECQWSGDSPKEDKCPACQAEGTMTASCPKCHHGYRLLADATLAATQPAAQGMDAQQYRLIERGELIEAGDQFLRDDFTWQIDPRGIFVGVPYGAALRPARRSLAAQAKQEQAA